MSRSDSLGPSMDGQLPASTPPEPSPKYFVVLAIMGLGGVLFLLAHLILPLVALNELRQLVSIPSVRVWASLIVLNILLLVGLRYMWRVERRGLWLTLASIEGIFLIYVIFLDPILSLVWFIAPLPILPVLPGHWREPR